MKAIPAEQKRFGTCIKRFKTECDYPVHSSIIIWRRDTPDTYRTISAIAGFRDLVSISVVPICWARAHRWQRAFGAMYSDTFSIYPWMVDKNGGDLITSTPAMRGVHEVRRHKGQSIAIPPAGLAMIRTDWEFAVGRDNATSPN